MAVARQKVEGRGKRGEDWGRKEECPTQHVECKRRDEDRKIDQYSLET
jgi:hypothetical protein